jgi:hypothetical protein
MKISTWHVRGAIGAVSLLVLGVLLGVVTDRVWLAHGHGDTIVTITHAPDSGPDHLAMLAFQDVLDLEADQIAAIHEILMRHQVRVDQAWESIRLHMSDGVEAAHAEIRALLTEEQQALFESWLDRHVRGTPEEDRALLWAN